MLKHFEFYAWLCDFKFSDLGYVLISRKNYRLVKINLPKKYRRELCLCLGQLDIFLINLKIRFCYSKLDIHTHVLLFYAVLIWEFSWFGFFPKCLYLKFIVSRYRTLFYGEYQKHFGRGNWTIQEMVNHFRSSWILAEPKVNSENLGILALQPHWP